MDKYTHIVLSGGGVKGLHYIGIYRYLKQNNLFSSVKHIVGCSIGSLFAYLYAMDLTVEELETFVFNSLSNPKNTTFTVDNISLFYNNKGLLDIYKLKNILIDAFKMKYKRKITNLTIQEFTKITGKNIYILSFKLSKSEAKIFSNIDTPNIDIFDAILSSMTLPLIFKPVEISNEYYIDGGVYTVFPFDFLNYLPTDKVLGIYINHNSCVPMDELRDSFNYFKSILWCITMDQNIIKYINEYKNLDNIDLFILDSYLPLLNISYDMDNISLKVSKEVYDDAICYGYNEIYKFLKNKSKDSS